MTSEQWQLVESVFDQAYQIPREARAELLAACCGNDRELHDYVQSLLEHHDRAAGFLAGSLWGPEPRLIDEASLLDTRPEARRIGAYQLVKPIAYGGMGVVYEAVQEQPQRRVALKLLRASIASPSALARSMDEETYIRGSMIVDVLRVGGSVERAPTLITNKRHLRISEVTAADICCSSILTRDQRSHIASAIRMAGVLTYR